MTYILTVYGCGLVTTSEQIRETSEPTLMNAKLLNKLTEDILEHLKAQMNLLTIHIQEVYEDIFLRELLKSISRSRCNRTISSHIPVRTKCLFDRA